VLNYGPRRLVCPAVLMMPEPCMWSMYAKSLFADGLHNTWKEITEQRGSTIEAQTQLHKIQHHSFLIPHSEIWIHYPHFYFPRRTFMSSDTRDPMASCPCPNPLFRHLFLSMQTVCALRHKSMQSSPHQQQPACLQLKDTSCPLTLNASDGELRHINRPDPSLKPRARELNLAIVQWYLG